MNFKLKGNAKVNPLKVDEDPFGKLRASEAVCGMHMHAR
jgi:hypothetical protein